ncbi:MAG: GNAT family N-acetyltransferase [bacterium]
MAYTWTPLTKDDVPEWAALTNRLAESDGTEEFYSEEDLAEELDFPDVDAALDTWAARDRSGALVAFGQALVRSALVEDAVAVNVSAGVHPDHRGRGLGSELIARVEARALDTAAERFPGRPVTVGLSCGVQVADARALFAEHGYVESRYFFEMEHALAEVTGRLSGTQLPVGVRAYVLDADAEPVLAAHNVAFAQHWRSAPRSEAEWDARVTSARSFRPAHSFVHADDARTIDGYVICSEYVPGQLYIGLLGVRPDARHRGIGTTLLHTVLGAAADAGYTKVGLDVDSANSSGAGRLYKAAGFSTVRSSLVALKTLSQD